MPVYPPQVYPPVHPVP